MRHNEKMRNTSFSSGVEMIVKKNLSEQIYEFLRRDILDQRIRFGEKLVNRYLQEKYGVSSTPVRDAINRLYLDGLLEEISNGGARVISFDQVMALELGEIVSMFMREAVALSMAKTKTETLGAELSGLIALQVKNFSEKTYFIYDKKFHNVFFQHCGNRRMVKIYNQYSALWELLVLFHYRERDGDMDKAIADHRKILDAVEENDVALTQQCVERHFQEAFRSLHTPSPENQAGVRHNPNMPSSAKL